MQNRKKFDLNICSSQFPFRWVKVSLPTIMALSGLILSDDFAAAQSIYNKFIFHPTKTPRGNWNYSSVCDIKPESVTFKSASKSQIHGLLYSVKGSNKTILLSHGNAYNCADRSGVVERLLKTGASVLIYDYAGYGESTGKPTVAGICKDGEAALNYLIEVRKVPLDRIILCGESLGTLVAGRLAENSKCAGLIMICPLLSLRRVGGDAISSVRYTPSSFFSSACKQLDNRVSLRASSVPKLFIAGTADPLTRIEQADELVAAAAEPKTYVRIAGAHHEDNLMLEDPAFNTALSDFVKAI